MEIHKESESYYLESELIMWVKEVALKEGRSASGHVNYLLRKEKERNGQGKKKEAALHSSQPEKDQ